MNKGILDKIDENTFIISDTHIGHGNQNKGILMFEPCRLETMRIDGYEAHEHDKWVIDSWNSVVSPTDTVLHLGDLAFKSGYYTEFFEEVFEKYKNVSPKEFKAKLKLTKPKSLKEIFEFSFQKDGLMSKEQFKSFITDYVPESDFYTRFKDLLNGNIIMVLGNHDPKPNDRKLNGIEVINGFYWNQGEILNKVCNPDPMFSGFIKDFKGKRYLFSHYEVYTTDEWDHKNKIIKPRIEVLKTIFEANNCDYNIHGHTHSAQSCTDFSKNVSFEQIGFKPIRIKEIL